MSHDIAPLLVSSENRITTLTLNRPDQYNALSEEMLDAIEGELDRLATDTDCQVVVIAARGRAFCAGHDLKQMRANPDRDYYRRLFGQCGRVMQKIMALPQPVIARVQGVATAAGCQLVATCDMAVAVDSARFAVSGINVGLFCNTPSVPLSRNLGRKRALELLLTGQFLDAQRAEAEGLINYAVPQEQLDSEVRRLADLICAKSPAAVRAGKGTFYRQLEMGVEGAYDLATEAMACNMMFEDAAEGIDAFMQKRPASWKGC